MHGFLSKTFEYNMEIMKEDINWSASSTLQFVKLDQRRPYGWGSGFALEIEGEHYLVSALHVAMHLPKLMLGTEKELGMKCVSLADWSFFSDAPRDDDGREYHPILDLAFMKVSNDVDLVRFDIQGGLNPPRGWQIRSFDISRPKNPYNAEHYEFAGLVEPDEVTDKDAPPHPTIIGAKFENVDHVTLTGIEGRIAHFKLPKGFSGKGISLAGTSGAPVLNRNHEPVAMVLSGSEKDETMDALLMTSIRDFIYARTGRMYDLDAVLKDENYKSTLFSYFAD